MKDAIQKGDQYAIPIIITMNDTYLTPSMCDDVRIKFGGDLKYYSRGEITFNSETNPPQWEYQVTKAQTKNWNGSVKYEVEVKIGEDKILSKNQTLVVNDSIITEAW